MKKFSKQWAGTTLISIALCVGLSATTVIQMGCTTSAPVVQYRTVGSVKLAVDTVMNAWADRVIDGKTTPAQEAQVKAAFNTYKAAALGYIDAVDGDKQLVPPDMFSAASTLINLLNTLGVKTGAKL